MGNQKPYIEGEQTTQWPKEKVQKDKQRSTKHTHKTKDRVTRTPLTVFLFSSTWFIIRTKQTSYGGFSRKTKISYPAPVIVLRSVMKMMYFHYIVLVILLVAFPLWFKS
jgi:hypothetical protein